MSLQSRCWYDMLVLWLIALTIVPGCSSRRINSRMDEQASLSRSSSTLVEETAKVVTPDRVKQIDMRLSEPAAVAAPSNPVSPEIQQLPKLPDVYFDFDQYAIRTEARSKLKTSATILKALSDHTIIVKGHYDERGTDAYNMVLGERRAQAVIRQLQSLGVSVSQLQTASYGKERPVCTEHSDTCRQLNRRVHFSWP